MTPTLEVRCGNPRCAKLFVPHHGAQKNCSRACTWRVASQRRNARGKIGARLPVKAPVAPGSLLAWAKRIRREALALLWRDEELPERVVAHLEALDADAGALARVLGELA